RLLRLVRLASRSTVAAKLQLMRCGSLPSVRIRWDIRADGVPKTPQFKVTILQSNLLASHRLRPYLGIGKFIDSTPPMCRCNSRYPETSRRHSIDIRPRGIPSTVSSNYGRRLKRSKQ